MELIVIFVIMNEKSFYVYVHWTRSENRSIFYVGMGKDDRFKETDSRNKYWHNVVNKYGGFDPEIIHDGLTVDEARELEKHYISLYGRRKYDKGGILVNLAEGGQGNAGFRKEYLMHPIVQLDLSGNFVKEYSCIEDTKNDGFNVDQVRWCANPAKRQLSHKGFLWVRKENAKCKGFISCVVASAANKKEFNKKEFSKNASKGQFKAFEKGTRVYKKVHHLDSDGTVINEFDSIYSAGEKLGISARHVRSLCAGYKKSSNYNLQYG